MSVKCILTDQISESSSESKRTCRFTIGTSTAGWTADQVDYLCDGEADDIEINAAIQTLPSGGGEIAILAAAPLGKIKIGQSKLNISRKEVYIIWMQKSLKK